MDIKAQIREEAEKKREQILKKHLGEPSEHSDGWKHYFIYKPQTTANILRAMEEYALSQSSELKVGLEELIKLQDEYILFLGNESNKYIHFAGIHGMRVPQEVFEQGQKFRDDISNKKLLLTCNL